VGSQFNSRWSALGSALALTVAWSSEARASGFELQTSSPAPAGDHFHLSPDGSISGESTFNARLFLSEAYKPLLKTPVPGGTRTSVSSQLYMNVGAAYALQKRFLFALDLPFVPHQGTDGPDSSGLGDPRLTARAGIVGLAPFSLGVEARLFVPIGSEDALTGDGAVRASAHVAASGGVSVLRWSASVGYLARREHSLVNGGVVGPALPFSLAAGIEAMDEKLLVGPELQGMTVVAGGASFFGNRTTPLIALLSARYRVDSVVVGLGFGPGMTRAPGVSPRIALSIGWEPKEAAAEKKPPPPKDVWDENIPIDVAPTAAPPPEAPPPERPSAEAPPPPPPEAAPVPPPEPATAPKADDAEIRTQARSLFQAGVVAYDHKHYAEALESFQKAYALKPHPIVLLNLAQSELMAGKLAEACTHFQTWKKDVENPTPAVQEQADQGIRRACH
jgi:hypothetical protein